MAYLSANHDSQLCHAADKNINTRRWVVAFKYDLNDTINHEKVYKVARGFTQAYTETSQMLHNSIRILLSL